MTLKPDKARGRMQASVPPASITSAAPRRIVIAASPRALLPLAQAE